MPQDLGDLILASEPAFGDAVAFQARRGLRLQRVTFREAAERAREVAGWLVARGLVPGDRVAVWSPNMPEYAVLYFGAWLAGLVVVPIDVRTPQDVLHRFVAAAEPRLGFKSRYLEGSFGPPVEATCILEDLFELVEGTPALAPLPRVGADHVAEIAYTSGTTGVPKGTLLTHANLLAEVAALRAVFPLARGERALSVLPLSHVLELTITLLLGFTCGVRVTYVPRLNPATITRALREDRVTCLAVVPELLRLLLAGMERRARQEGRWRRWQLAHRVAGRLPLPLRRLLFRPVHRAVGGQLRFFGVGGAPLDAKLAAAWERMGIRVFEGYGLTETSGAAALNIWTARRFGSVGRPVPGVEIKIGEGDEVMVRGPTVTQGYHQNAALNAEAFSEGWFRTGDTGFVDADGFLHIAGREAFKIVLPDGRKVYPEDVERVLNQHPLVRESCVVGVDRERGEQVHAVVLTDQPDGAWEAVRETNRQLAPQQQIRSHSLWTEEDFPRTATLKIDRKLVREAVARQATTAAAEPGAGPAQAERAIPPGRAELAAGPGEADALAALLARVAERPVSEVHDQAEVEADLGLDSLARVELLAAIEEELGRVVDETKVGPQTTVGELRRLVAEGGPGGPDLQPARWPRAPWARAARPLLQWLVFRVQDVWMDLEVVHPERAARLPLPSILIFNYHGPYAALVVLRALAPRIRARTALAAEDRLWQGRDWWQGRLGALAVQAFPFAKSGGAVRHSLEQTGRWLDDGYAVILSPEGEPELEGELLPFLGGTGLIAVEMQVPIVPFRLEGYFDLFPRYPEFPYLPVRRGRVRLIVGEPITFPKDMPHQTATERARQALVEAG